MFTLHGSPLGTPAWRHGHSPKISNRKVPGQAPGHTSISGSHFSWPRRSTMTAIETPEQAADHAAKLAAARKAKDAERKREERKRLRDEKEKAAAEKKASEAKSFPEYWQQQRANLTEAQRTEYEQRESDVLDLEFAMKKYIDGVYEQTVDPENRVPLESIAAEVQEEVKTHGVCES